MGCQNQRPLVNSIAEESIDTLQKRLRLQSYKANDLIPLLKKYSHNGELIQKQLKTILSCKKLLTSEDDTRWNDFYSKLENKKGSRERYFDVVGLILTFILLCKDNISQKVELLFDILDIKLRDYLTAEEIQKVITHFCVISGCYLPMYAQRNCFMYCQTLTELCSQYRYSYLIVAQQMTFKLLDEEEIITKAKFKQRMKDREIKTIFYPNQLRKMMAEIKQEDSTHSSDANLSFQMVSQYEYKISKQNSPLFKKSKISESIKSHPSKNPTKNKSSTSKLIAPERYISKTTPRRRNTKNDYNYASFQIEFI